MYMQEYDMYGIGKLGILIEKIWKIRVEIGKLKIGKLDSSLGF